VLVAYMIQYHSKVQFSGGHTAGLCSVRWLTTMGQEKASSLFWQRGQNGTPRSVALVGLFTQFSSASLPFPHYHLTLILGLLGPSEA
jgi:hypothetical protein